MVPEPRRPPPPSPSTGRGKEALLGDRKTHSSPSKLRFGSSNGGATSPTASSNTSRNSSQAASPSIIRRAAQSVHGFGQLLALRGGGTVLFLDLGQLVRRDKVDRADTFARSGQPVERFGFGIAVRHILFGELELL